MSATINYSEVPYNYIHCTGQGCPNAQNCLRHLAYCEAPVTHASLKLINPRWLATQQMPCERFRSSEKTKYAIGFTNLEKQVKVGVANLFKLLLMKQFGRKGYYERRKGSRPISPDEQQIIIEIAQKMGVTMESYFDAYEEDLNW